MSQRVGTPVNQVRHTNVATVRMKKKGKPFEIACYRNKVLSWRNKIETDLDEVLQIDNVFTNVSKGMLANSKDILACFDTDDSKLVIKEILEKGELQITDQERSVMQENIFKDVAAIVADKCINPENNRPYTVGMIQNAMKQIHYGVNLTKSAKSQALDVIKKLKRTMPIARAPMSLRVIFPTDRATHVREEFNAIPGIFISTLVYSEGAPLPPKEKKEAEGGSFDPRDEEVEAVVVPPPPPTDGGDTVQSCEFHADPDSYRRIQEVVGKLGSSRAYVEVLSLNAVATATATATATTTASDYVTEDVTKMAAVEGGEQGGPLPQAVTVGERGGLGDVDKEEWVVKAVEGMVLSKKKKNKEEKRRAKLEQQDEDASGGEATPAPSVVSAGGTEEGDGKKMKGSSKQSKKAKRAEKEKSEQQEAEKLAMKARLEQEKVRQAQVDNPADEAPAVAAAPSGDTKACTTCGGAFDKAAYREHFRSEWHRCNLKRRMEGASVLSEQEFLTLST